MCDMSLSKLYVDDVRDPPDASWTTARNFHTAIYLLENMNFDVVSLDNDLGEDSFYGLKELQGYDILQWLIYRKQLGKHTPPIVYCHSANVVRKSDMVKDIQKYFGDN